VFSHFEQTVRSFQPFFIPLGIRQRSPLAARWRPSRSCYWQSQLAFCYLSVSMQQRKPVWQNRIVECFVYCLLCAMNSCCSQQYCCQNFGGDNGYLSFKFHKYCHKTAKCLLHLNIVNKVCRCTKRNATRYSQWHWANSSVGHSECCTQRLRHCSTKWRNEWAGIAQWV